MEFPYTYRKHQKDIVDDIERAVEGKTHLVFEATSGSGKTICALYPTLSYTIPNSKKVLYITRTNSQQRQVIHELRMLNVFGMGIQGRQNLCPIFKEHEDLRYGDAEELSKLCIDKKSATLKGDSSACPYYYNSLNIDENKIKKRLEKIPTVEEFSAYCRQRKLCAYELTKQHLGDCNLVVAPYIYFINFTIRKNLLEWINTKLEDLVLIVDEAHNLADYIRDMLTAQLSLKSLSLAGKEALEFGNQELLDILTSVDLFMLLSNIIKKIKDQYLKDEDALIPSRGLEEELYLDVGTSKNLKLLIKNLMMFGEGIRELKRKHNRLPRSHIYHVGSFLYHWTSGDDELYVKLISNPKNPTLQLYCLDPKEATTIMKKCHSTIHMSGTLHPLEEYRDSIDLPEETALKRYPSPFPPENRALLYTDDVTTRFEEFRKEENIAKLKNWILSMSQVEKNTAFFFPSYDVMAAFLDLKKQMSKPVFIESRVKGQDELVKTIREFKESRNSALFGVMGGRLSEGIDFPNQELEMVVIVGIPYPKPTAKQRALMMYYDIKFNKGWEYGVRTPTVRKMHQAIGRLIRNENDRGLAIILDRRAKNFKDELKGLDKLDKKKSKLERFFTPR